MDSVLAQNLAQIKLKEAASGAEVELDRVILPLLNLTKMEL